MRRLLILSPCPNSHDVCVNEPTDLCVLCATKSAPAAMASIGNVLQYIENRKALGYVPNGADDMTLETIWVLQE